MGAERIQRSISLALAAAALAGCALESGLPRSRQPEPYSVRQDKVDEIGNVLALARAKPSGIACPHCGETSSLGASHCIACGRRITPNPVTTPCVHCGGSGKVQGGAACAACASRGTQQRFDAARLHLPVFMVPEADARGGNEIERVFVGPLRGGRIAITIVFRDEDHPVPAVDAVYDAYRALHYGRIEDVETLEYVYDEKGAPGGLPAEIHFSGTHSGTQGFRILKADHHSARLPLTRFELRSGRPVIYVNTWNHLFSAGNTNPDERLREMSDYPVEEAERQEVETILKARRRGS